MKALFAPIPSVVLAILLSVGGVSVWFMRLTERLVAQAASTRVEEHEASRPEKPWDFWTPEMEVMVKELKEQREALLRRETALADWEKRLAAERAELDEVRKQVDGLRGEIDARLVEVQAQELRNLKTLATTYSRFAPASAVAVFSQMDDLMVAKLLSLMKAEVSSAILEELSRTPAPDNANVKRAAELTQRLRLLLPAKG